MGEAGGAGRVVHLRVYLNARLRQHFEEEVGVQYRENSPASQANYLKQEAPYKQKRPQISVHNYECGIDGRNILRILRFRKFKLTDLHLSSDPDGNPPTYLVAILARNGNSISPMNWKKMSDILEETFEASFHTLEVKVEDLDDSVIEWITVGKRTAGEGSLSLAYNYKEARWDLRSKKPSLSRTA